MTILCVLAVRDRALDAFMQPFFVPATGVGIRSFSDEVNRDQSPMFAHADDYDLYEIGSYDDAVGALVPCEPRQVARAKDVKRAASSGDLMGAPGGPQGRREGA